MMQVTGSKPSQETAAKSILSIRLSPDGFYFNVICDGKTSFSAHQILTDAVDLKDIFGKLDTLTFAYKSVFLMYDTIECALFPSNMANNLETHLELSGILLNNDSRVMCSKNGEISVAIKVKSQICDYLDALYGSKIAYIHPLGILTSYTPDKPTIYIYRTSQNVHIAAYSDQLIAVESLPCSTEADLVFVVNKLIERFCDVNFTLSISGDSAKSDLKHLSTYFKSCHIGKEIIYHENN